MIQHAPLIIVPLIVAGLIVSVIWMLMREDRRKFAARYREFK